MAHEFRIDDRRRAFGDLTIDDITWIRDHPDPGSPLGPDELNELIETMRRGGAAKVDDLGREAAERWARTIGIVPKF
jgi:hypothetical protein